MLVSAADALRCLVAASALFRQRPVGGCLCVQVCVCVVGEERTQRGALTLAFGIFSSAWTRLGQSGGRRGQAQPDRPAISPVSVSVGMCVGQWEGRKRQA